MRAHANCVENLPVFGAIVLGLSFAHVDSPVVDALCLAVLPARVIQSLTHICFTETARSVSIRFSFFTAQFVCFMALAAIALVRGCGAQSSFRWQSRGRGEPAAAPAMARRAR